MTFRHKPKEAVDRTAMPQRCIQFNECGGCDMQDVSYAAGLAIKQDRLKAIFAGLEAERFEAITPSPRIWYYRNKMEYAVSGTCENVVIGLRRKKRFHKIIDIGQCSIFYERVGEIFTIFRSWIRDRKIVPYDLFTHTGWMRYIVLRHSKFYDEIMVVVVMAIPPEVFTREKDIFLDIVARLKALGNIKSILLSINNSVADTAVSSGAFLLDGEWYIKERVNGIDYLIGPSTFFQTNSFCCAELYNIVTGELKNSKGRNILDLYCGSGGITLQVAGLCSEAIGVDSSSKNIEDAINNAKLNGIKNAVFVLGQTEDFLTRLKSSKSLSDISAIIVDPPRAGLDKKTRLITAGSEVEKVIYVSCNPESMAGDLKVFAKCYKIKRIAPVDMFPHTRHVEAVAVLEKR